MRHTSGAPRALKSIAAAAVAAAAATIAAVAFASTSACGRQSSAPPPHGDAQPQPQAQAQAAAKSPATPASETDAADPYVLRVTPEMLRDLRITTIRIDPRNGAEAASLLGELRVDERRYAEVGSPIIARTLRLLAAPGDRVKAGAGLAVLHSVELGKARAEYLAAAARLELASRTLDRKRDLANERITPLREVQEAEAQRTSADAEVRAARATLAAFGVSADAKDAAARARASSTSGSPSDAAARARTSANTTANDAATASARTQTAANTSAHAAATAPARTEAEADLDSSAASQFVLRAPIGGTVLDRGIATGQMVDPAKPLFRIADLAHVWLVVHAFERDAVRLSEGAAARVTLPALPGRTFQGRVSFIGREVDATSRTIPVRIELPNADGLLRPGMSASASLPIGATQSTLMVPAPAIQRVGDQWCVFMPRASASSAASGAGASAGADASDPSSFTIRPVGRGRDFGNDVEVLSGLRAGDTVVVEGAFLLRAEAEKARGGSADRDDH